MTELPEPAEVFSAVMALLTPDRFSVCARAPVIVMVPPKSARLPLRLTVFELAPELETVILPGLLPALVGLKRT